MAKKQLPEDWLRDALSAVQTERRRAKKKKSKSPSEPEQATSVSRKQTEEIRLSPGDGSSITIERTTYPKEGRL